MNKLFTKIKSIAGLVLFTSFLSFGQNNSKMEVEKIFYKLVSAYGNSKAAPKLMYFQETVKATTPALYTSNPQPTIKFDLKFYELCRTFGKDSLNAVSIVLGHELAHHYNEHTFCSDFAFALRNKNDTLSSKLKLTSKTEKMSLETQADHKGMFYAAAAGYNPFDIQERLLDEIYKYYKLPDVNPGYPSKQERKDIAKTVIDKSEKLYITFTSGIEAIKIKDFEKAISSFDEINQYFPSRENYNNSGVAKTLQALQYKTIGRGETLHPNRFVYPIAYDSISRLTNSKPNKTRAIEDEQAIAMEKLLKSAKADFEKAIQLDPDYSTSYINLACVFDLLDNREAAIGKIKELPLAEQKKTNAQRILAIAYYNLDSESKADEIWRELKM